MKVEEDRKERRRKLGLPEELTEEEKEKEEKRRQAKMKEDAQRLEKHVAYAKPVGITEKLRKILVGMKKGAGKMDGCLCLSLYLLASGDAAFKTSCSVLLKYVGNIAKNPEEEKFRRIRLSNAAFQQKVASVTGGVDFLVACGFGYDTDREFLTITRDAVNPETLDAAGTVLDSAMNNPFFGQL